MKKIIPLFFFLASAINGFSQPVVYFDFVTHNEDSGPWGNTPYYTADRAKLISLANYFQTKGITLNMQSDWLYLTNNISKETPALQATTNNKNILRWMVEDKGVEMDPHSHENQYIYPDIVKLMDSIGLPESKLIGGSLYGEKNGMNVWSNMINGQNGVIFPNKFWAPDYLMGGGSKMHVADLNYYGFWNPKDTDNYLTHFPSNHLRHIGVGCDMKIWDTSTVAVIVAQLKDVVQKVQGGQYPASGFYIQTIFFGHGDLNNTAFYNKLIEVADSANAIVATGKAQWKTLKQAYTLWETVYNAQMFQLECGDVVSVEENTTESNSMAYPNPTSGKINFELKRAIGTDAELEIYNVLGKLIHRSAIINSQIEMDVHDFPRGIYLYQMKEREQIISTGKIIVQ